VQNFRIGGQACKPDSVRRASEDRLAHRGNHSSRSGIAPGLQQPTRGFTSFHAHMAQRNESFHASPRKRQRAGPALPSYLALHHAGFSVPPASLPERWALTPPFHPYQARRLSKACLRFPSRPAAATQRCGSLARIRNRTGGIFSVALSVAHLSPRVTRFPGRTKSSGAAPWRYQARCPAVSGLSSRCNVLRRRSQRSPGLPANSGIKCSTATLPRVRCDSGLVILEEG
jgi:hypothetical protein